MNEFTDVGTIYHRRKVVNTFAAEAVLRKAPAPPPWTRLTLQQFAHTALPDPTLPRVDLIAKEPKPGGKLTLIFPTESAKIWREHNRKSPLPEGTTVVLTPADSLTIDDMNTIMNDHDPLNDGYLIDLFAFAPWHRRLVQQLGNPQANLSMFTSKTGDSYATN